MLSCHVSFCLHETSFLSTKSPDTMVGVARRCLWDLLGHGAKKAVVEGAAHPKQLWHGVLRSCGSRGVSGEGSPFPRVHSPDEMLVVMKQQ